MSLIIKSIKKNICSAIFALLIVTFSIPAFGPAFADEVKESAVEVTSYDFDAVVHKDHVYTISEKIKINVQGQLTEYRIRIPKGNYKVDNIKVKDSIFNVQSSAYDYEVVIKSPEDLGRGKHTLNLNYTIKSFADNDKKGDLFYMNVLPTTFATPIKNMKINVLFPKDFVWDDMQYFAGQYGVQDVSNKITVNANGNEINVTGVNIPPNFGIMLKAKLPENYWRGELNNAWMSKLILGLIIVTILTLIVLWLSGGRDPEVNLKKEIFPKGGIPPAEANYLINGNVSVHDVVAMILYLGTKGYLKIVEYAPKKYQLFRLTDPAGEPKYVRSFYHNLFDNVFPQRAINMESFLNKISNLQKNLSYSVISAYSGREMLSITNKSKAFRITGIAIISILNSAIIAMSMFGRYVQVSYMYLLEIFVLTAVAIVLIMFGLDSLYRPNWLVNVFMLAAGSLLLIGTTIHVGLDFYVTFRSMLIMIIYFAASAFSIFMIYIMKARAIGNAKAVTDVLSLRHFISHAKKSELKEITKAESDYFFDTIPYAYAFLLLDKWGMKFKDKDMDEPIWFYSDTDLYNMDLKKYGSKSIRFTKNIDKFGRTIQSEYALLLHRRRNG